MQDHGCNEAVTGVTERTLKGALGGSFAPLIDLIAAGSIKGVAAVVGCSNLRAKGHDVFTVELVKKTDCQRYTGGVCRMYLRRP